MPFSLVCLFGLLLESLQLCDIYAGAEVSLAFGACYTGKLDVPATGTSTRSQPIICLFEF